LEKLQHLNLEQTAQSFFNPYSRLPFQSPDEKSGGFPTTTGGYFKIFGLLFIFGLLLTFI
jgi:hypothetical protein